MLGKASNEAVIYAFLHVKSGGRDAHLARVAELGGRRQADRFFKITIVENQNWRMATQFHGGPFHAIGGKLKQMFANWHGSCEAHLADDGGCYQMAADHVGHAIDQLRNISGHATIDDTLHDRACASGCFFRRLSDDGASCGQSSRHFLAHQVHREVPWRKCGHWPNWLFQHQRPLPSWPHKHASVAAFGFLGEIIELRGTGQHFSARFGERLALFGGKQNGDCFGAFANTISDLV